MSNRASPILGFGFSLGDETEIEVPDFVTLRDASYDCADEDWPVELVPHGYHDYRFWFVAIRGSVLREAEWGSMIRASEIQSPTPEKIAAAKEWCKARDIPWSEPELVAMATYD